MNPFGQEVPNPSRAVLLLEDHDGVQHGWEIFNGQARYQITGYPRGSAHATVTVSGEFHRIKYGADQTTLVLGATEQELESGDG